MMDSQQFDRLARRLSGAVSRRTTLAALLGAGLAGVVGGVEAKGKKGRHRKGKAAAKRRRQDKQKPQRSPAGDAVAAEAADCANPGPSSNMNKCNFNDRDFTGIDLSSSSMRETKFRGADLCGADLSSSQLKQADFRGFAANKTDLTRADLSSSGCNGTRFNANTIFCGTRTCNGAIRNDGCPAGVDPDDICCVDDECEAAAVCVGGRCCHVCADGCPYDSLAAAVADPDGPAIIRLCPGAFHTVNVNITALNENSTRELTIIGAGAGDDPDSDTILDAEEDGRVLFISPTADVELRGLRVTGGRALSPAGEAIGGGIDNRGVLRLVGVVVAGNEAELGGGIYNPFGTLILGNGARVAENEAEDGAGIHNGGSMFLESGARVEDNDATSGGGGIFNHDGTLTMRAGSRVEGNTARAGGGGLFHVVGTATLEAGSVVTGNTLTGGSGGGIFVVAGAVNVANNTIVTLNTPDNCRPENAVPNCTN